MAIHGCQRWGSRKKKPEQSVTEYWAGLLQFGLGKLGWSPSEFWRATEFELHCACLGYNERIETEAKLLRHSTHIIAASFVGGKNINIDKLWPIGKPEKIDAKPFTEDEIAKIKLTYDKIIKKHRRKK